MLCSNDPHYALTYAQTTKLLRRSYAVALHGIISVVGLSSSASLVSVAHGKCNIWRPFARRAMVAAEVGLAGHVTSFPGLLQTQTPSAAVHTQTSIQEHVSMQEIQTFEWGT